MAFQYDKLLGKIVEVFGTREKFAEAMGMSYATLYSKLNNKTDWKREEILKAAKLLGIDLAGLGDYFFSF